MRVANAATHLGMEVYGYDPFISVNAAWSLSRNVKHINSVEEIYSACDFITIHVPLLDDTKKMLNKELEKIEERTKYFIKEKKQMEELYQFMNEAKQKIEIADSFKDKEDVRDAGGT